MYPVKVNHYLHAVKVNYNLHPVKVNHYLHAVGVNCNSHTVKVNLNLQLHHCFRRDATEYPTVFDVNMVRFNLSPVLKALGM
jgi:hypothetical protein